LREVYAEAESYASPSPTFESSARSELQAEEIASRSLNTFPGRVVRHEHERTSLRGRAFLQRHRLERFHSASLSSTFRNFRSMSVISMSVNPSAASIPETHFEVDVLRKPVRRRHSSRSDVEIVIDAEPGVPFNFHASADVPLQTTGHSSAPAQRCSEPSSAI
jgi:hypothetical protein